MSVTVSITLDTDRDEARRLVEAAGFTVTRVTAARAPRATATTPPHPFTRASALLDMPAGLDREEQRAYVKGYAIGCTRYTRRHGAPSITGWPVDRAQLRKVTVEHEWARHPGAHAAALRELERFRTAQRPTTHVGGAQIAS